MLHPQVKKKAEKPLTNAERQQRYREKRDADPTRRAEYLLSEQDRYLKDKAQGRKKCVKDMTPREHRKQKKAWRIRYHNAKEKKKI